MDDTRATIPTVVVGYTLVLGFIIFFVSFLSPSNHSTRHEPHGAFTEDGALFFSNMNF